MAGTKAGAIKARKTIIEKYGRDHWASIGQVGGQNSVSGGFASHVTGKDGLTGVQRSKVVGFKGGKISKRPASIKYVYKGKPKTLVEIGQKLGIGYQGARAYAIRNKLERLS